jgi:NADPH2:quinone reductase
MTLRDIAHQQGGTIMKAMLSHQPGGPETLQLTESQTPSPKAGELLIRIHAAGVNFPDTLMIHDLYQTKPTRPFAPGGEIAGEVEAIGEGVTGFSVGDRILALTGSGGFATHLCIPASIALKIPDEMPYDHAACFIFTYGTSYHAIKDRGQVQPGESLFILGAAGGVGAAAIELGKAAGARVIAGVSSEEKAEFARQLGADDVLIYPRTLDRDAQKALSKQIKSLVGPNGVDVVYDAVGGDYAEPSLRAMAWKGRYLVVGFPAGIPKIPLNLTLLKGSQIVGVFWGAQTTQEPEMHAANMADLFDLYKAGKITPRISARYTLEETEKALVEMASRRLHGKAVIEMA